MKQSTSICILHELGCIVLLLLREATVMTKS